MIDTDKDWKIEYWSKQLEKLSDDSQLLLQGWFNNHSLSIEEQWAVMNTIMQYNSYSRLLARDLAQPESKLSQLKRLLRRK